MNRDWLNSKGFHIASMAFVFVSSLVISVYLISFVPHIERKTETEALVNAPVTTQTTEVDTETQTVPPSETQTASTTATSTTRKLNANKQVHTVLASGDKKKDEDKGNDKVIDDSLKQDWESGTNKIPSHDTSVPPKPTPQPKPPKPSEPENPQMPQRTKFYYVNPKGASGWKIYGDALFYFDEKTHQPLKGLQAFDDNPRDKFPGFYYYFNEYGAKASVLGIDVSHHNGKIDWKKVKAEGIDYAIIRVGFRGYGTTDPIKPVMIDKRLEENIRDAKSVGLPIGLYFYSQAINVEEALEEAGACVNIAEKYGVQYPIYFDTEFATGDRSGRADKLSKRTRTDLAVAFCEAVKNAGYTPGVYASKAFYYDNLEYARLKKYEIWVAHYTNKKTGTDFKHPYEMWQYASDGVVNGSSMHTDMNIGYYDYKTRSDMRQNGKNVIFADDQSVRQFSLAEAAFDRYVQTGKEEDYVYAKERILALARVDVRGTLLKDLEKVKAYFEAHEKETELEIEQKVKVQFEGLAALPQMIESYKIKTIFSKFKI